METRKPGYYLSNWTLINLMKGYRFYYIEEQNFVFIQMGGIQDEDIQLSPGIFAGVDEEGQIVCIEIYMSRN